MLYNIQQTFSSSRLASGIPATGKPEKERLHLLENDKFGTISEVQEINSGGNTLRTQARGIN